MPECREDFQAKKVLIFRACSKNLFFCRPENLTGMRKSKRSGCVSFAYFALHKQRKVGRPLGETEVSMQGAAAVKWGCPLGEIKVSMQGEAAVK